MSNLSATAPLPRVRLLIALGVGALEFVTVLLGIQDATAAAPGGLLSGPGAFLASLISSASAGALTTWLQFFGWSCVLGFVFGLIGVVRRKKRWFIPLLWIAALVGSSAATFLITTLQSWLGSASPGRWDGANTWYPPFWDAAAFWAATMAVGVLLLLTLPSYVRGLWRWNNGGVIGQDGFWFQVPMFTAAFAIGSIPFAISWAALLFTIGLFHR